MKIINQKENWDCGISATAMFTDLDYDTTKQKYFCHANTEISVREIIKALEEDYPNIYRLEYASMSTKNLGRYKAILLVPSKNDRLGAHYVYWDGKGILDPQKGNEGKKHYEYDEDTSIIWIVANGILKN